MGILKKKTIASAINHGINALAANMKAKGGQLVKPETTRVAFATEGLSDIQHGNLVASVSEVEQELSAVLQEENINVSGIALEALSTVAIAGADAAAYYRAGKNYVAPSDAEVVNDGNFALEAYEDRNFEEYVAHSVYFTQGTVQQNAFGEAFFPTVLVEADSPMLVSDVNSTVVTQEVRHALSGEVTDTVDRNLALAVKDPTLLSSESTKVYPSVALDDSNADKFVDASIAPVKTISVEGADVRVAPLRINKNLNILGLASNAANLDGAVLDITDVLDNRVLLDTILIKVTHLGADKAEGGGDDTISYIEVPVATLPKAQFVPSREGSNDELDLFFTNGAYLLKSTTKDTDGVAAAALASLTTNAFTINLELFGRVNMRTSNMKVSSAGTDINVIMDSDGAILSKSEGNGKVINESFSIEVLGYTIDAKRTNSNRRSMGISVDSRSNRTMWNVGCRAPLYNRKPSADGTEDGMVVDNLIAASRKVTAIESVTALLAHLRKLEDYYANGKDLLASDVFKGASNEVIPYYKHIGLDVKAQIDSISTHEKSADLRGLLTDTISHELAVMATESNYLTALEMLNGGEPENLRVVVGTDPVLHRLLMQSGDDRTFGEGVEPVIVASTDDRMKNKIVVTFQRDSAKGFGPLSAGGRAYIPELIGTTQVTRNGSTSKELVVQPREEIVAILPVALEIDVTKLSELLTTKAS